MAGAPDTASVVTVTAVAVVAVASVDAVDLPVCVYNCCKLNFLYF